MKLAKPTSGMNVRNALWLAHKLGATVVAKPATDDMVISHPRVARRVVQSMGRKDANRELTGLLREIWNLLFGNGSSIVAI